MRSGMERAELEQWKGREVARLLALVESERRYYQEIVASIPVGLLVLSSDLSIVSSNRGARRSLGLRTTESLRGRLDAWMPGWVLERMQGVFKGCERVDNLMVEHGERTLRVSVLPIRNDDEDNQHEALMSIEDLTGASAPAAVAPAPAPAPAAEAAPSEAAPEPAVPEAAPEAPAAEPPTETAAAVPVPEPVEPEPAAPAAPSPGPAGDEAVELLQSLNAIIWAADIPSMSFLFVTNTTEEVLGFHPDHWLSTPTFWADRIYAEDREAILKGYHDAIAHSQRHTCEFRSRAADGRLVWLRESTRILADAEGRPKHLIGLTIDISERHQLEEQHVRAERMDAMGKLASRLSHDLNNMLMIVNGYGEELLHNVAKNDPLRTDVQEILNATGRISALTNELLAFTRRQAPAPEILGLSEVVSALEEALRKIAGPGMAIEIETDSGLQARAGRMQIEQMLTSLAERARAAMHESGREQGKLVITVGESQIDEDLRRVEPVLAPGMYAVISVEDNDGLLSHDAQMALFESFLPVKEFPGETGAILSRGYALVRQWGGDISVETSQGGSRISIFLPYAGRKEAVAEPHNLEPATAPAPVEAPVTTPAAEPERETILVVEDEAGIRALVRKILRRQGYTVLEASNGEDATKICQEHSGKIHLLITDVMMPKMGGRELVDTLKEQCGDMKVLYVSGYTDDAGIMTSVI